MPVRIAGHRDVLPAGAVRSLNGLVRAGLGVRPSAPGQEVGLGGLLRPPCSGICDYLLLVPPRHPPHSSAINLFVLLVFTAWCLDKSRYLYTSSKLRSLSVQLLLVAVQANEETRFGIFKPLNFLFRK